MRRSLLLLLVLAGLLMAGVTATATSPASAAVARSQNSLFPGRARCGFSNFYVDYRQTFPSFPPQISVFTRDPNGTWHLVMWYRYQNGLYFFQFYPACTNGARVRTLPTQGAGVVGRAGGFGHYALHCRYNAAVEFQQQWGGGQDSILYLAAGHTNRGWVRVIFNPKHTQVAFNLSHCQVSTKDLPVFPLGA